MNTIHRTIVILAAIMSLIITGCGPGELFGPTITPTATMTPTITPTSAPTVTPTPAPATIHGRIYVTTWERPWITDVELYNDEGNLVATTTTDSEGYYSFQVSRLGTYGAIVWKINTNGKSLFPECSAGDDEVSWIIQGEAHYDINTGWDWKYMYYISPNITVEGGEDVEQNLDIACS